MRSALVIGCAACVWDDIKAAQELVKFDAIYCVKQMGVYYPKKFDVWVTLHPEAMDVYEIERKALSFPGGYEIVAPLAREVGMHGAKGNISRRVSYLWPDSDGSSSASSGIYGAKIALDDGFDKVVLAGIPMSPDGGHFKPDSKNVNGQKRGPVWTGCVSFEVGFNKAVPRLMGKVKSMSGRTRKILGAPSAEWVRA